MSVHQQWDQYEDFVSGFPDLANFVPDEFLYLGGSHNDTTSRCHGLNWYPDEQLWEDIYSLARHVQDVRTGFGGAIFLTSIYRNQSYNTCIGGAQNSYHMQGKAADMVPINNDVSGLWKVADALTPEGGVGRYSSFVHVDIRGYKARW